jgi:hypothetical protein
MPPSGFLWPERRYPEAWGGPRFNIHAREDQTQHRDRWGARRRKDGQARGLVRVWLGRPGARPSKGMAESKAAV